jgi:TonB family protein
MPQLPITHFEVRQGIERRRLIAVCVSIAVHCLILGLLLPSSIPVILKPRVLMQGSHGGSMASVYVPSDLVLISLPEAHSSYHLPSPPLKPRVAKVKIPPKAREETSGAALQAAHAGSPFGSQPNGLTTGHELRPALPIEGGRPRVAASDLPGGLQGDVIVEITINEQGKVIEKKVIKSIDPGIDNKVLAALEKWQFTPATQDGKAIASQQYVYFHFPS